MNKVLDFIARILVDPAHSSYIYSRRDSNRLNMHTLNLISTSAVFSYVLSSQPRDIDLTKI